MRRTIRYPKSRLARKRKIKLKLASLFLACAIIVAGSVWLSRAKILSVQSIVVSAESDTLRESVRQFVSEELSEYWFKIIPKKNIALYPDKALKKRILQSFPQIADVYFSVNKERTLAVDLAERKNFAIWCDGEYGEEDSVVQCYYLDASGKIYESAPHVTGGLYYVFYGGRIATNSKSPIGADLLPKEIFTSIISFLKAMEELNLYATVIRILERDYEITTKEGSKIIAPQGEVLGETLNKLKLALNAAPLKNETAREKLEYIDLRFGNKVYYKWR